MSKHLRVLVISSVLLSPGVAWAQNTQPGCDQVRQTEALLTAIFNNVANNPGLPPVASTPVQGGFQSALQQINAATDRVCQTQVSP
jgi:hypothetical protein